MRDTKRPRDGRRTDSFRQKTMQVKTLALALAALGPATGAAAQGAPPQSLQTDPQQGATPRPPEVTQPVPLPPSSAPSTQVPELQPRSIPVQTLGPPPEIPYRQSEVTLATPDAALPAPVVDRLAACCLALIERSDITPGEASAASYAAMAALHDGTFATSAATTPALPPAITRVVSHIEANLVWPLQVERLAMIADMSRAHFVRQFTLATGSAPSDYVLARRVERIERLLLATDMSVSAIARATGFADANYLAKVFRRRRGMAPLAFRASQRLGGAA